MKRNIYYYTVLLPIAFGIGLIVQALADTQFKGVFVFVALAVVAIFKPIFFAKNTSLNSNAWQDHATSFKNSSVNTSTHDESYIAGVNGATGLPTFNGVDTSGNADGTNASLHDQY